MRTALAIPGWQWASKWYADPARRTTTLSHMAPTIATTPSIPAHVRGKTSRRPAATPTVAVPSTTLTEQDDDAFLAYLAGVLEQQERPENTPTPVTGGAEVLVRDLNADPNKEQSDD